MIWDLKDSIWYLKVHIFDVFIVNAFQAISIIHYIEVEIHLICLTKFLLILVLN